MGDIDWASVFGTLESAALPPGGRPAYPSAGQTGSYTGHQPHDALRAHPNLQAQNAEAGRSRPHPPSRSHSMPDAGDLDDSAFSLFAHDHTSRAWFANHADTHNRHSVAGPSFPVGGQSHEGFVVPHVPPPTPAPLTRLDSFQATSAAGQPFLAHLATANSLPFVFGHTAQSQLQQSGPFDPGVINDSPDSGGSGLVAMSRPPSTPASARPTPNAVLDQEDKRVRNTMASAKFRAKKKQQTEEMQRTVNDLEGQKMQLEKDVTSLKQENGLLREIVQLKYGWKVDSNKAEPVSEDKGKQSET